MATKTTERYIEGLGRRKTATARVRLTPAKETTILVNEKVVSLKELRLRQIGRIAQNELSDFRLYFDDDVQLINEHLQKKS